MHALYRNHMGSDLEVVNDARTSFAASSEAVSWDMQEIPHRCESASATHANIPKLSKKDRGLIQFLARGCRSGDWLNLLNTVMGNHLTQEDAQALLSFVKRMPAHWTPFGQ